MSTVEMSYTVSNLIVKRCTRELSGLAEKYLSQASMRVNAAWNKGRKKQSLNMEKTIVNINRYLNRFTIPVSADINELRIRTNSVALINNQLTLVIGYFSFFDSNMQPNFEFSMTVSKKVISRHALSRWLKRNNSDDYKLGLNILCSGLLNEETALNMKAVHQGKISNGECERQIELSDGGVGFIAMINVADDDCVNSEMTWVLTTYIDKSIRCNWNDVNINSEYSNMIDNNIEDKMNATWSVLCQEDVKETNFSLNALNRGLELGDY